MEVAFGKMERAKEEAMQKLSNALPPRGCRACTRCGDPLVIVPDTLRIYKSWFSPLNGQPILRLMSQFVCPCGKGNHEVYATNCEVWNYEAYKWYESKPGIPGI